LDFLTGGSTTRPVESVATRPRSAPHLAVREIDSYKALCHSNDGLMKLELNMKKIPK
jgi:hypothetical protein